jgi:hypothetical protein
MPLRSLHGCQNPPRHHITRPLPGWFLLYDFQSGTAVHYSIHTLLASNILSRFAVLRVTDLLYGPRPFLSQRYSTQVGMGHLWAEPINTRTMPFLLTLMICCGTNSSYLHTLVSRYGFSSLSFPQTSHHVTLSPISRSTYVFFLLFLWWEWGSRNIRFTIYYYYIELNLVLTTSTWFVQKYIGDAWSSNTSFSNYHQLVAHNCLVAQMQDMGTLGNDGSRTCQG